MAGANTDIPPMAEPRLHESALAAPTGVGIERGSQQYYALQRAILGASKGLLGPRSLVIDMECRGGDLVSPVLRHSCRSCRFIALERSASSAEESRDRFRHLIGLGKVEVGTIDLGKDFPAVHSDLTLCVNGLAHLSAARQDEVLSLVRKHIDRDGAFVLVEEDAQRDWRAAILQAGFREATPIWRADGHTALLARK